MNMPFIPRIPLGDWIQTGLDYFTEHFAFITEGFAAFVRHSIAQFNTALLWLPEYVFIILAFLGCWKIAGRRIAIGALLGLLLIWNLGLWESMIYTLTLVIISTLIAIIIAIPLGIGAALSNRFHAVVMPILDFMQTMPAFVYLIPAISFFSIGAASGIFATVIFAMPPAVRFTSLGIRQTRSDLIEAADAFGATPMQKLFKVQLPQAWSTIMAGINQTIMLSLSMVVIAAMVGVRGLGQEVWGAIQQMNIPSGFEAGIAVVIVAMILDRVTQNLRKK